MKRFFTMFFLLGVVLVVSFPYSVLASVAFTPAKIEYDADPGNVIEDSFKVTNKSETRALFQISVMNFLAGSDGFPIPYEPGSEEDDGHGIAQFIQFPEDPFYLEPGEKFFVPFTIHVPKEVALGGYYGVLLVQELDERFIGGQEDENAVAGLVAVNSKSGPLVLLQVGGKDLRASLVVNRFKRDKRIYSSLPVEFITELENQSLTFVKPGGTISVRNMFGKESTSLEFNQGEGNILPSSTRNFSTYWSKSDVLDDASEIVKEFKNFGFGRYRATLTMSYAVGAEDTDVVKASQIFWVIPWQLLLVFLAVLIVIRFILRRYNMAVVKSVQKKHSR